MAHAKTLQRSFLLKVGVSEATKQPSHHLLKGEGSQHQGRIAYEYR